MQVIKDVSLLSRWITIDLYIRQVDSMKFELSMNRCSDSLSKLEQVACPFCGVSVYDRSLLRCFWGFGS
ncbi:putative phosphoenolpyruvate carboxylase [Rosa chinensis]|uniref:Putative phosphoenolpyruvate carboxylase n=1 Tax=Rosa chinensis TaxID=74649 RepID=A0A2P6QRC8_ROSCH|nr:putative phosphoenolpyruvate carboxylase [Rosa chinensis]